MINNKSNLFNLINILYIFKKIKILKNLFIDSTLTFVGVYMDNNEIRYVAINNNNQKRETFTLDGKWY